MFQFFTNLKVDWLGWRKPFIFVSILVLLAGLFSAVAREMTPGGTDAFNLGVDFQGGTVTVVKFKERPSIEAIRSALGTAGVQDPVIQDSLDRTDEVLIKTPLPAGVDAASVTTEATEQTEKYADGKEVPAIPVLSSEVEEGLAKIRTALNTFGPEAGVKLQLEQDEAAAYQIVGVDSVGPIAGAQLRDAAVIATLLGLVGMMFFIAYRYDWTYAAGAVVAVFHDVLVTMAFFSVFQWEISLSVVAAMLTLVGFSVNDTIVIFDRIRENLTLNRSEPLYEATNRSINQTMSRTVVTNGLTFFAVISLVIFGGEVLRGFSLALFVGVIAGTYSTIAIASPIAIWWQGMLGKAELKDPTAGAATPSSGGDKMASASRRSVARRPVTR